MKKRGNNVLKERRTFNIEHLKGKLSFLLISLSLLLIIPSFLDNANEVGSMIIVLLFSIIPLAGVYMVSHDKNKLILAIALGIPFIALNWINIFIIDNLLFTITTMISVIFYTYTASIIFLYIIHSRKVTKETIYSAVCIYLLIGILWASIYTSLNHFVPGSFATNTGQILISWNDFIYYSFVTLTTLGLGDIIPISSYSKSLTIIESVIGVLYIAILIARLVGTHIAQSLKTNIKKK